MEPPLLSPRADSSALDEPQVDHLVKLEESEDVEGEQNRLVKCFKLRIFFLFKGLVASCHSFLLYWFFFHTYNTFTHSYIHKHSPRLTSIQRQEIFLHQLFFLRPCLKYFAKRLFYFKNQVLPDIKIFVIT